MTAINRLAMLVLGLGLIMGSALGSEYSFGSKVYPGDSDVGRTLLPFPTIQVQSPLDIMYWNIGTPVYDDQDIVYWHVVSNGVNVAANDIRLTAYAGHPAGSKVTPFDNDIGQGPLAPLPGFWIRWLNLYGGATPDLEDPIFASTVAGGPSNLNHVRLTDSEGMLPGTKLRNSDPDFADPYSLFGVPYTLPTIGFPFEFFDTNGNGIYDYLDDVYLHMPTAVVSQVNVNDVRLSGPT